ncbi:hypothetical protein [Dawidia soli]|uniref:Uncharacterized protein n=1 Tax=Dawidia soli TaxID=2782352 RepID=A0AAP2DBB2_9BACT|nr:hypothetical protein [Dawidia soli]MBT1688863.1 hypothetical protein [Dawidia soli]
MTLISLSLNHGNPIMMADLLFSSENSNSNIAIPTLVKGMDDHHPDTEYKNILVVYIVKSHYDGQYYLPPYSIVENKNELHKSAIKFKRTGDRFYVHTSKDQHDIIRDQPLSELQSQSRN